MNFQNTRIQFLVLFSATFLFQSCNLWSDESGKDGLSFDSIQVHYPKTYQDTTVVDTFFGKAISDPYRWLENDNSEATKRWVKTQNQTTFGYLDNIPYRDIIEKRLEELWNFERYSTPFKEGGKYYYFKNDGLQNQSILYSQSALDAPADIVLDPNKLSDDGTASLGNISFSGDGSLLAYQVSEGGSDWRTIYVKNLSSGQILDDTIRWVKFSGIAWQGDGFFYSRYPEPEDGGALSGQNVFQQVYFHTVGTSQEEDELIFADRTNPRRGFGASTTDDERFLVLRVWESTSGNALYFRDLNADDGDFQYVVEGYDNDFNVVDNIGDNLLVLTNHNAPNQRLIAVNSTKPQKEFWEELIPESEDVLQSVELIGGRIIAKYIHNAASQIKIFSLTGNLENELELPETIGTVGSINGKKDSQEAFYSFSNYTMPTTIYELDLATLQSSVFQKPNILFDHNDYETKQVWFESYDKTSVPMFITHKKGMVLDGNRPTLLYGYGGFDISILPRFDIKTTVLLENNGIYAVANIRGGGEFGKDWHQAGTKKQKQNVFNDFQAAAEYLIDQGYTSSEKLAIEGRSNGGLLVGACMTQRPDLYKVAFPGVGVLDMLRYHEFTIGRAWATDYGLSENESDFDYLIAYSPLHNIEKTTYPATLITTADHDDRVVPAHSFKFASELQKNHRGDNPVLIRIETSAGHGAGKPTSKRIEESADMMSFMLYNMKENVLYEYSLEN